MNTAILETDTLLEAANVEDGWYLLSPYGDHPNPVGLQRMDRAAANAMVGQMNSSLTRLKSALGFGSPSIPAYRGHPDHPTLSGEAGHDDFTRYAEIDRIEARDDGIYGHFAWANTWNEIKDKLPKLSISPRWAMIETAKGSKIFQPRKLLSVGLVPRGNITGTDAVNSETPTMNKEKVLQLLALLGQALTAESTDEQINTAVDAAIAANTAAADEKKKAEDELAKTKADLAASNSAREAANAATAAERKARSVEAVNTAIAAGKITAAERASWEAKLTGAGDFTAAVNELTTKTPAVKTTPAVTDLAHRNAAQSASDEFEAAVNELAAKDSRPRNQVWVEFAATERGKALTKKMQEK